LKAREQFGAIRERSSVAVYRSMWSALTTWCVSRGLRLNDLKPGHFDAYLHARGGVDQLTARYVWRLFMLAEAVQCHHAVVTGDVRNVAAHEVLMATQAEKAPLPPSYSARNRRTGSFIQTVLVGRIDGESISQSKKPGQRMTGLCL
jgi:hypothetical protein